MRNYFDYYCCCCYCGRSRSVEISLSPLFLLFCFFCLFLAWGIFGVGETRSPLRYKGGDGNRFFVWDRGRGRKIFYHRRSETKECNPRFRPVAIPKCSVLNYNGKNNECTVLDYNGEDEQYWMSVEKEICFKRYSI